MMKPEAVTYQLSQLRPGAPITIEITTPAGQRAKCRSIYVGFLPKHYVLVQMPDTSKIPQVAQYISQGTACTIRGLIEGSSGAVIAFITTIERTVQLPSRLIVLSLPSDVEIQPLRKNIRINTDLNVFLTINDKPWQGTLLDLSVDGCLVSVDNAIDLLVKPGDNIVLKVKDDDLAANYTLQATLCNSKLTDDTGSLGLKFADKSQEYSGELLRKILFSH